MVIGSSALWHHHFVPTKNIDTSVTLYYLYVDLSEGSFQDNTCNNI